MRIGPVDGIEGKPVDMEGARGVRMRIIVGEEHGAPNFVMRVFDVEPGGHTPLHAHPFEHGVLVLSGRGELVEEGRREPLAPGDAVFVPGGTVHQFRAAQDSPLRFLCVVPKT